MTQRRFLAFFLLGALIFPALASAGQDDSDAQQSFNQGDVLLQQGRFDEALAFTLAVCR